MNITLVYAAAPRTVHERALSVPPGTRLDQVLELSAWDTEFPDITAKRLPSSVWGRKAKSSTVLNEGDRVEWCRALRVDPKVARRERFVGQGARATGLFASRRPGAKAGY